MLHRAEVGEGKHRHPRLDSQPQHELRRRRSDLRQRLRVRLDVHRRVGEEKRLLAEDHHVNAAGVFAAGLHADHLQGWSDGIRIVDLLAGDERIRTARAQHQQAVVHRVEHATLRFAERHAAPLPAVPELCSHLLTVARGRRIDELHVFERERRFVGLTADCVEIAEQDGPRDAFIGEDARGAQDAGVVAFGEDDARRILLRARNQAAHHLSLGAKPRLELGAILFDVDDAAGDTRCYGSPRHGGRDPQQHARIEGFGD